MQMYYRYIDCCAGNRCVGISNRFNEFKILYLVSEFIEKPMEVFLPMDVRRFPLFHL